MTEDETIAHEIRQEWHGSLSAYIIGLILSVVLSLAAYFVVVKQLLSGWHLTTILLALGIAQAVAQLLFFLHLSKEARPRWNVFVFLLMATVLLIVVLGSLWVMSDLNERMMSNME